MLVKRINNYYEFLSSSFDGAFIIKLTLTDKGKERLVTIPVGVPVSFTPRDLEPGTIRKAIGEERWENFLRMKESGIFAMFIDPHYKGFIPQVW